ncbi:MAG: hypothetical protein C5B59_08815 [Bacteroidetes bacterium]|nr:MAG: hypothetical protein C5B59_08815 [Bacteroidota bacterium]
MAQDYSFAFGKYLEIASKGNVFIELSVSINRRRLVCKICHEHLAFEQDYEVEALYWRYGSLDQKVQDFVKEHRHEKISADAGKIITVDSLDKMNKVLDTLAVGNKTATGTPIPKPREGRRFR